MAHETTQQPKPVRERPSNAQTCVEVTHKDLPLHCPMPGTSLWDSHPRVYLPIEDSGQERCPYCGTIYILQR